MISLKQPYVRIRRNGALSYGGSQMWNENKNIRVCGCGAVAALDTVLYLSGRKNEPMSPEEYNRELALLCRKYFPLLPPFGINGLSLALGMNLLLRKEGLPYRAFWAVSGSKFWDRIEELLQQDIPAIFSIGPNFPAVWGKQRLTFYVKSPDGRYTPASSARAHYVCATGLDKEWLHISSWGRAYFIRRAEFDEYVKKHSLALVSNILMLRKTR
jgi:hypothetical protein